MKSQEYTPQEERKLRFAEAGILFALILGIAIFVGVRIGGDGQEVAPAPATEIALEAPSVPTVETEPEAVVAEAAQETMNETMTEPVVETPPAAPMVVTYTMAEQAYFDKDYDGAADLFARYVAAHPDNAWGYYMLGLSSWKAGDLEDADDAFAAALERDPKHIKSLVNDARVLLALDRTDDADARITVALDLDPANADAYRVQGRVRQAQARIDEAVASYEDALRLDGDDVWSLNNLGLLMIQQERCEEALAPLAKAAGLDPSLACVQNNLGVALERTGHYAAAADAYARALDADAGYAKAEASHERILALVENQAGEPVDLVALAASFSVAPATDTTLAAADAGMEPQSPDMEVAAAVVSPATAVTMPPAGSADAEDGDQR